MKKLKFNVQKITPLAMFICFYTALMITPNAKGTHTALDKISRSFGTLFAKSFHFPSKKDAPIIKK